MNISIKYYDGSNIRYIYLYMEYTLLYFYTAKQIYIYIREIWNIRKVTRFFYIFHFIEKGMVSVELLRIGSLTVLNG